MGVPADVNKFLSSIDAIHQSLCKGSLSLHLSRIDSKANHPHHSLYLKDCDHLKITQVSAFIREAYCGEFDYTPSSSPFMETYPTLQFQSVPLPNQVMRSVAKLIPRLWVLVTDFGEGTMHVSTIYRGPAMWKVVERDGREVAHFDSNVELVEALAKAQACEGFDTTAWKKFAQQYWDACVIDAAADTGETAIN